jgi:RNase P/RNase MRP subunit POP5
MPASKSRGRRKLSYTYIRFNFTLDSPKLKASPESFTEALDTALTTLYGCIGGALIWDLVNFDNELSIATIQCQKRDEERIWAAASFLTQVKGSFCRLQVLESSPALMPASEQLTPS